MEPASGKSSLIFWQTIEYGFTLKFVRGMIITYTTEGELWYGVSKVWHALLDFTPAIFVVTVEQKAMRTKNLSVNERLASYK